MPAKIEDWSGQVIGDNRFKVTSRLGEGGMGFVYRALDLRLETDVVIKVPHPDLLVKPEIARRFLREGKSLVRLNHPNVVNVLDVGQHDHLPYIVMQYLAGGDLADRLKQYQQTKKFPEISDVVQWLRPIASALDFVHARGFVHRDIKPANILFDEFDHPYLSDFGIIKGIGEDVVQNTRKLTSTGMAVGTPDYMAPELIMGGDITGAVDQYALGIVVFESLCGCLPFIANTVGAIMVQHTSAAPPDPCDFNSSLNKDISAAIAKALAKEAKDRFATVLELIEGLSSTQYAPNANSSQTGQASIAVPEDTASITAPGARTETTKQAACPKCTQKFSISSKVAGKAVRCPKCKQKWHIDEALNVSLAPSGIAAQQRSTLAVQAAAPVDARPKQPTREQSQTSDSAATDRSLLQDSSSKALPFGKKQIASLIGVGVVVAVVSMIIANRKPKTVSRAEVSTPEFAYAITVVNPSFEDQQLADGQWRDGTLNGWVLSDHFGGAQNFTDDQYSGATDTHNRPQTEKPIPDGKNVAFSRGVDISQTLDDFLLPNTLYSLAVDVGCRLDGLFPKYKIQLLANDTVLAECDTPVTPPRGRWKNAAVEYQTGLDDPELGTALSIRIITYDVPDDVGLTQANYDNVRLIAMPRY